MGRTISYGNVNYHLIGLEVGKVAICALVVVAICHTKHDLGTNESWNSKKRLSRIEASWEHYDHIKTITPELLAFIQMQNIANRVGF